MSFNVGDRVKVVNAEQSLLYEGMTGTVNGHYRTTAGTHPFVEWDNGFNTGGHFVHGYRLQRIPKESYNPSHIVAYLTPNETKTLRAILAEEVERNNNNFPYIEELFDIRRKLKEQDD